MPEPQEKKVVVPARRPRPRGKTVLHWTAWAVGDIAENVGDIAGSLSKGDGTQAVTQYVRLFSLRRWAFLFPGGGALRGQPRPTRVYPRPEATPSAGGAAAPAQVPTYTTATVRNWRKAPIPPPSAQAQKTPPPAAQKPPTGQFQPPPPPPAPDKKKKK